jgi:hypothetical protein
MAGFAPLIARSGVASASTAKRAAAEQPKKKTPAVRPKLKVSDPSEPMEREADRAADRVTRQAPPSFPMAGPKREPEPTAHRAAKKDDKAKRETKKDEKAKRATKKDDKAKRETRKDDKAKRAVEKDDKAKREAKKDEKAKRAAKKDEKAKRETRKDDKAKRETNKDDKAKRDVAAGDGAHTGGDGGVPTGFEASLARARQSGGETLVAPARQQMESGFGQSFDSVRVHHDSAAAGLADSISARAFTLGNDVFFGAGQYQPHTPDGRRLIAHEFAHIVQGSDGRVAQPSLWRVPKQQTTTAPTTGDKPGTTPDAKPAPAQASVGPARFDGKNRVAFIKETVPNKAGGTLELPTLKVPTVEGGVKGAQNHPVAAIKGVPGDKKNAIVTGAPFEYLGATPRGSLSARQTWIGAAKNNTELQNALKDKIETRFGGKGATAPASAKRGGGEEDPAPLAQGEDTSYYLRPNRGGAAPYFIVGTSTEVAAHEFVVLPIWNKKKGPADFDVDHLMELQLGGKDGWENFWVLDASANRSSGSKIHSQLTKDVEAAIKEAQKGDATGSFWVKERGGKEPTVEDVLANWRIRFASPFQDLPIAGDKTSFWTRDEIKDGEHLDGLKPMSEKAIAAAGLRFKPGTHPTFVNVFSNPNGGFFKRIDHKGKAWVPKESELYRGLDQIKVDIEDFDSVEDNRKIGCITGRAFYKSSKKGDIYGPPDVKLPLLQSKRLGFGVYVDRKPLNEALHALHMKGVSPVEIDDAGISADGAMFVSGRIIASLPLFQGTEIPFSIYGDSITLSFAIPVDRLKLGPVRATDASIEIGVGAKGLILTGGIGFEIKNVGHGRLEAYAGGPPKGAPAPKAAPEGGQGDTEGPGFSFIGSFTFDTDKLDPATITVGYSHHQFTVDALVGLAKGAVKGIDQAEIHVTSDEKGVSIDGFAVLGIPPLKGTRLIVRRDANGAIEIAAEDVPLPVGGIPGVKSATATIRIAKNPDTGEWVVSGGGSAEIGVGGFSGVLVVDVNGPFVTIAGKNLSLQRGPLKGLGYFQVTNRPLDPAGNPIEGGEPGDMNVSGHVEASMPLGSYLTATLGGTFLPNGELDFTGGVSLPPTVNLFERKSFDRELFRPPPLDIPIFGISALGHRIGIFATIGGSLSFTAGIGPGQLRNAALTADFNPDHPENTTVAGHAEFFVPADAGLRLEIHGGIGAGIPIVSAEAGIEIGGKLGVEAEASAAIDVTWSPQVGLDLNAIAHIAAQPQFTFDISAYVAVTLDTWVHTFHLYDNHWNLTSFTFGPQLAIGADLPIHWSERAGLDFDVDKITIHRPEIDVKQLGMDLIHHLVD